MSDIFKVYKNSAWEEPNDVKKYSGSAWESCDSVKRYKDGAWTEIWSGKEYVSISQSTLPSSTILGRVTGSEENMPDDAYGIWHLGDSTCKSTSIFFEVPVDTIIPGTTNLITVDFDYDGLLSYYNSAGTGYTRSVGTVLVVYRANTSANASSVTAVSSINTDGWEHSYSYFYCANLAMLQLKFTFASTSISSSYSPNWIFDIGNLYINGKRYYMPK